MTMWHLWIDPIARPGWQNMAIDQALLDLATTNRLQVLRLYRWHPFCLSFGRHEPALRRYDRGRITELGLDTVRRPTGGRAVWHARELTYAVAAPFLWGGLRQTYCTIHEMFAQAIQTLGAPAELAGDGARPPRPGEGACFARPVGGEVLIDGRKVVGSAQLRSQTAFLQHGSLLLDDDQQLVRDLGRETSAVASELPLSASLGRTIGFDQAAEAVRQAAGQWTGPWQAGTDPAPFLRRAESHQARFRDPAWTWER